MPTSNSSEDWDSVFLDWPINLRWCLLFFMGWSMVSNITLFVPDMYVLWIALKPIVPIIIIVQLWAHSCSVPDNTYHYHCTPWPLYLSWFWSNQLSFYFDYDIGLYSMLFFSTDNLKLPIFVTMICLVGQLQHLVDQYYTFVFSST